VPWGQPGRCFVEEADRGQWTQLPECLDDFIDESNPVRVNDVFVDGGDDGPRKRQQPAAQAPKEAIWVARPGMDPFSTYDANYLIDNKAGIIIDASDIRRTLSAPVCWSY
jgi:hypothetical protein